MVHNGIEYADMQLIAEAYDLIRRGTGKTPAEIADVFAEWNTGELEATSSRSPPRCCARSDAATGKPLVDVILDQAGAKGTGAWTVQNALDLGVPVVGHRRGRVRPLLSSQARAARGRRRPARPGRGVDGRAADADAFIEDVRLALYASKIIAYSQGFDEIVAGAEQYGWDIDKGDDREDLARRLHHPRPVPQPHRRRVRRRPPTSSRCVTAPYFVDAVGRRAGQRGAGSSRSRRSAGIPAPAFSSSLAYYDGLRAERLPAALVQGQRDFFGAHTYKRVDKPGTFHTLWSGDRTEIETTPSSH